MTNFLIALNPLGGIASSTIEGGIDDCYSNTGVRFLVLSPLFALLRLYRVGAQFPGTGLLPGAFPLHDKREAIVEPR